MQESFELSGVPGDASELRVATGDPAAPETTAPDDAGDYQAQITIVIDDAGGTQVSGNINDEIAAFGILRAGGTVTTIKPLPVPQPGRIVLTVGITAANKPVLIGNVLDRWIAYGLLAKAEAILHEHHAELRERQGLLMPGAAVPHAPQRHRRR